jgi:hypothetical protein
VLPILSRDLLSSVGATANIGDEGLRVIRDDRHHLQNASEYLPERALCLVALYLEKLCTRRGV